MHDNQNCSWLIQPKTLVAEITLIFEHISLTDAELSIYDGVSTSSGLLWTCHGCSHRPPPLTALSGSMLVIFWSGPKASMGYPDDGFRVMYYSCIEHIVAPKDPGSSWPIRRHSLLPMPADLSNTSNFVWHIPMSQKEGEGKLTYGDVISRPCTATQEPKCLDGSNGRIEQAALNISPQFCGAVFLTGLEPPFAFEEGSMFINNDLAPRSVWPLDKETQCILSTSGGKYQSDTDEFLSHYPSCVYIFDAGTRYRATINVTISLNLESTNSFVIYAGKSRNGKQLYFCGPKFATKPPLGNDQDKGDELYIPPHNLTCADANTTMIFMSECGALFVEYYQSDDNEAVWKNTTFSMNFSWTRFHIGLAANELCIDDSEWQQENNDDDQSKRSKCGMI